MSYILQRAVFPTFSLCSERDLYFRFNDLVDLDMNTSVLMLRPKGRLFTDTYFNSVSVGKWKRHTTVNDLNLTIKFKGKIKITWFLHRPHFRGRILAENYLTSKGLKEISVPLEFWGNLEDGMLVFDIEALEETQVVDFYYWTNTPPTNKVKLGIVITHFNRQKYVLPAIARLKEQLLDLPEFKDRVSLFVVDNSQNLPPIENVTIIPNENLGGAGGFSRGLLTLKESKDYTHCLFMDDDASCEVDGIKRTLALLTYAKDKELAVGGAMLREETMYLQYENGARFDGLLHPNKAGLDLRQQNSCIVNEFEERIDFCGWWFFAFPLSKVKHLAFPFFVRGDDIGFGLAHKFNIITLNGISSWQGDFALKHNPLTVYLDNRHQIMQHFHHGDDEGLKNLLLITARMFMHNLLTYHYETAEAIIYSIQDTTKGKDFWKENVNMVEKRKQISALAKHEKPEDISLDLFAGAMGGNPHEGRMARLFRWATLNGHLLPTIFFKKGYVWQDKGHSHLREIYRFKRVLYIHRPSNKGFVLKHNKKKFFSLLFSYLCAVYKLAKNYKRLKKEYAESYDELTSPEFWKKQFKTK